MNITEIAPDIFRLSLFIPEANLQFNQFLVRDDEPLLFHTGMRGIFPIVQDAVARLIDAAKLRHISFSHFERSRRCTVQHIPVMGRLLCKNSMRL